MKDIVKTDVNFKKEEVIFYIHKYSDIDTESILKDYNKEQLRKREYYRGGWYPVLSKKELAEIEIDLEEWKENKIKEFFPLIPNTFKVIVEVKNF